MALVKNSLIFRDLNTNSFTGVIPDYFGSKPNLIDLDISNNPTLTGTFPKTMLNKLFPGGQCTFAKTNVCFGPGYNGNCGILVACPNYCSTAASIWIDMGGAISNVPNNYASDCCTDNRILCDLSMQITQIDFSNSNLVLAIPASIADLSYLNTIYFRNNSIIGGIPLQLGSLNQLQRL